MLTVVLALCALFCQFATSAVLRSTREIPDETIRRNLAARSPLTTPREVSACCRSPDTYLAAWSRGPACPRWCPEFCASRYHSVKRRLHLDWYRLIAGSTPPMAPKPRKGSFSQRCHSGHFGLHTMRERSARIRAKLMITSSRNSGTAVILRVPGEIA